MTKINEELDPAYATRVTRNMALAFLVVAAVSIVAILDGTRSAAPDDGAKFEKTLVLIIGIVGLASAIAGLVLALVKRSAYRQKLRNTKQS